MAGIAKTFAGLLDALGFDGRGASGVRAKSVNGNRLAVDFAKEHIDYGSVKRGSETTSNFAQPENIVVLECVHRLLEKGYHPRDITLEKQWKLGRIPKGGRADILVRDKDGKTLLIVECKTWGAEFDKEQRRMRAGGGQLFSYLQQDKNAKYLCLYASHAELKPQAKTPRAEYKNAIVKIEDRDEDIKARREDETVKLYRDANTVVELYEVWKERFNLYFHYNGIFEGDVNAYGIELKPLKKKNLLPFDEAVGVFNQFAEILRHNNISDNANAFNRVLSLLLCKMVDEEKGEDEVLGFQVKEGEDTPEIIHDRLQKLYHKGMEKYLRESVVYHSDEEIAGIIKAYPRQTRLEKITRIFREIKYYTNNEFAFKEVHNKELFEQNGRVLNEVVKMLQNYRFKHTKKQQILGDFFELLLNHGVKQSEGQFFTPVPIVRFILLSIGLERIIAQKRAKGEECFLPKILDYACGAGHFLTESIDELQGHLRLMPDYANGDKRQARAINKIRDRYRESTEWAKDYIFGIEKDYRLARTAQIACFINGDGDANIIFGDGLEDHKRLLDAGKFDLIVANPPYSVKAFKNYLHVPKGKYQLFDKLSESAGEIQVLFLERAAQMLAVGGIAGIIMPASILANGGIDAAARRLMLKKFEIKAFANFGGATFSATPTNTVVLFLRRRPDCFALDRRYIADDLFGGAARPRHKDFIDSERLLADFAEQKRGLPVAEYKTLINKTPSAAVRKSEWFNNYRQNTGAKQAEQTEKEFVESVLESEREKFYIYMLCMGEGCESQNIVAVNSGVSLDAQKAFLGYSHSKRKGSEGAKRLRDDEGKYGGKMYDDDDRQNPRRASSYIRAHIWGDAPMDIDDSMKQHVKRARLVDCLNFDSTPFIAAINAKTARAAPREEFGKRYPAIRLTDICDMAANAPARFKGNKLYYDTKAVGAHGVELKPATVTYANRPSRANCQPPLNAVGFAKMKGANKTLFVDDSLAGALFSTGFQFLVPKDGRLDAKFLLAFVRSDYFQKQKDETSSDGIMGGATLRGIANLKIPLPPLDIQRKIIKECEAIDRSANAAGKEKVRLRAAMTAKIQKAANAVPGGKRKQLDSVIYPIAPPFKFAKTEFGAEGKFPIIDQSQNEIAGWTDDESALVKSGLPVVVFGDHTCCVKYAPAPFAQGADGIKIIATTGELLPEFLYYWLKHIPVFSKGYKRHFSELKRLRIPLPPMKAQREVAGECGDIDRRIAELDAEIDAVQGRKSAILKKYL